MLTGVIFCDSDNFVAREIKSVTGEAESHVALLFEETVLHYRFLGFESMHIDEFKETYAVSAILVPPQVIMVNASSVIKRYKGGAYDFLGMLYVGLYLLFLRRGIQLPGKNQLQSKRDRFCVEFVSEICLGESGSMLTPAQLHKMLISRGYREAK